MENFSNDAAASRTQQKHKQQTHKSNLITNALGNKNSTLFFQREAGARQHDTAHNKKRTSFFPIFFPFVFHRKEKTPRPTPPRFPSPRRPLPSLLFCNQERQKNRKANKKKQLFFPPLINPIIRVAPAASLLRPFCPCPSPSGSAPAAPAARAPTLPLPASSTAGTLPRRP